MGREAGSAPLRGVARACPGGAGRAERRKLWPPIWPHFSSVWSWRSFDLRGLSERRTKVTEKTSRSVPCVPTGPRSGAQSGAGPVLGWDLDRGKDGTGGDAGEGAARWLGLLAWAPGILQWSAALHQWASLVPPPRRLGRQSGGRLGHFAPSGRVAVLSGFAFSLVQPGSGQDPFPK